MKVTASIVITPKHVTFINDKSKDSVSGFDLSELTPSSLARLSGLTFNNKAVTHVHLGEQHCKFWTFTDWYR